MLVNHDWVPPLVGGWFWAGRAIPCPLNMNKMWIQKWWAWFFVSTMSRRASMEVKLSPMEVEIFCELLEVEVTSSMGGIVKAATFDRLEGWWFHLPNLDIWTDGGRTPLYPLIMRKMMFQWWWAWILVSAPSCMASMEVKLSPIEVEKWCELWETPSEGDNFLVAAVDKWGGWRFHLPNFVYLIFLYPASAMGDPFTIEVGKGTAMCGKIFEGAGLRIGSRWFRISGAEKKRKAACCLVLMFLC
jgi:hypothetical protein